MNHTGCRHRRTYAKVVHIASLSHSNPVDSPFELEHIANICRHRNADPWICVQYVVVRSAESGFRILKNGVAFDQTVGK